MLQIFCVDVESKKNDSIEFRIQLEVDPSDRRAAKYKNMVNFILIFITFIAGSLAKNTKRFPVTTAVALNQFVIFISLPAMVLAKLPPLLRDLDLQGNWWIAVSMPWILFFCSWIFIRSIGKKRNWSPAKTGALILTAGLGNTSFVGFPLLEATLGSSAIPYGVLTDQLGSFLILATLGLVVASIYSGQEIKASAMAKRLFSFPPFVALIFSLLWSQVHLPGEEVMRLVFDRVSLTLVPLSLFSVGFQTSFKWALIKRRVQPLTLGLSFKLFIMPMLFYVLYFKLLGQNDLLTQTTFLESAMATQITAAVVASEYNLDTELANLMVSLSIPISIVTVPLIHYFFLT